MSQWQAKNYRTIFQNASFRRFWFGFTFSAVGDAMTRIALIWFVYQSTGSPQAIGILLLCYTGPVVVGGFVAGALLDRFDRRIVMLIDNGFRGTVVALIPFLYYSGHLALWHLYLVAGVWMFHDDLIGWRTFPHSWPRLSISVSDRECIGNPELHVKRGDWSADCWSPDCQVWCALGDCDRCALICYLCSGFDACACQSRARHRSAGGSCPLPLP